VQDFEAWVGRWRSAGRTGQMPPDPMLIWIVNLCGGTALLLVLIASIRARRSAHHDITASEIHPDLAAGEDLVQDVLAEYQRMDDAPPEGGSSVES
jgi:hypothetical protein